jgi:hypothetical protein
VLFIVFEIFESDFMTFNSVEIPLQFKPQSYLPKQVKKMMAKKTYTLSSVIDCQGAGCIVGEDNNVMCQKQNCQGTTIEDSVYTTYVKRIDDETKTTQWYKMGKDTQEKAYESTVLTKTYPHILVY